MILADTAIWVDHLNRGGDPIMEARLDAGEVAMHPFIRGEIALGSLRDRALLDDLRLLRHVVCAEDDEVIALIQRHRLFATGLGWVDAHLLAATLLTPGTHLWTRDRRLHEAAERLGVAAGS